MESFAPVTLPTVVPLDLTKHVNYVPGMVLDEADFRQEFAYLSGRDAWLARDRGVFHQTTPLTLAETASVFGETVTNNALLATLDDPAARFALLASTLEDSIATVFRQVAMNRFEDAVHTARRTEGELSVERLSKSDRERVVDDLRRLRRRFSKLQLPEGLLDVYARPPDSPENCIFAQTTDCFSSDLERRVLPCQLGGNPDCNNCGCMASAGLEAIGRHRYKGWIPVGRVFYASVKVGKTVGRLRGAAVQTTEAPVQSVP